MDTPEMNTDLAIEVTSTEKIGTSALWGILAKVFSVVANLVIGIIIARSLGTSGKGVYAFVQQIVGVLAVVLSLGLSTSNVYFVASKKISAKDATANSFWLSLAMTAISAVVFYLFLIGPFAPPENYSPIFVALATALFFTTTIYSWFGAVSIGSVGLRVQSISTIVSVIFAVAATAFLATSGLLDAVDALFVGVLTQGFAALIVLGLQFKKMVSLRPNLRAFASMVSYSSKSYIVNLVSYLHLRQDVLLLGWLSTIENVGIYSVAVGFAEIIRYIPSIINNALFARISRPEESDSLAVSFMLSRLMVIFIAAVAIFFAIFAPFVIPSFYGSAFSQGIGVFYFLLPGAISLSLSEISAAYLFSREIIYWNYSIVAVVLNVILNLILIPRIGLYGAAIASSVTYTLFACMIVWLVHKHTGASLGDLFAPKRQDLATLGKAVKSLFSTGKQAG